MVAGSTSASPQSAPTLQHSSSHHLTANGVHHMSPSTNPLKRPRTPVSVHDHAANSSAASVVDDRDPVDERRQALMKDLWARSERMIAKLFSDAPKEDSITRPSDGLGCGKTASAEASQPARLAAKAKKPARTIDEDDYGDDEEDDEEAESEQHATLQTPVSNVTQHTPSHKPLTAPHLKPPLERSSAAPAENAKSSEEVRKRLEEEKKAAEDAAKESFRSMFYTLENDRDAMLEQQKLDELDRQVEHEMSGEGNTAGTASAANGTSSSQQGTLSSANLGASSLTLKHLISRIDSKRAQVRASDTQLRTLMSEVRKNRSKWANEDRVGQEELYEAAERVLMELKSMTDYAAPFLQRVNKRDVPDYHRVITHPMDIGTMIKKLKGLEYKSKKEFCQHLDLIWANCLKYNSVEGHPLRKKAEHMRKETSRLIPLIPDITIRDRAEVEREERNAQLADAEGSESDDDDKPIAATRGRKAPSKGNKGSGGPARKAPSAAEESSPAPEARAHSAAPGPLSTLRAEHLRGDAESATDGSQIGLSTPPPPGNATPLGANGTTASQADVSELEGMSASINGMGAGLQDEPDEEDPEYKTWKQVTKKDRARVASERHRLFKQDKLNVDEPALLRSKAGMRRWVRQQKLLAGGAEGAESTAKDQDKHAEPTSGATLAEGIDGDDDNTLPDYYDPIAGMPELNKQLQWVEDNQGYAIDHKEECLRVIPQGHLQAPKSTLNDVMERNMRQMQDTRKDVSRISMVKQMQLQAQTYTNQFQAYVVEPFVEHDPGPFVMSDDGPLIATWTCRAALKRSVGKVFFHAGFEETQPSALEAVTEMAEEYFVNLVRSLCVYSEQPLVQTVPAETSSQERLVNAVGHVTDVPAGDATESKRLKPRFSPEELILHTLHENGLDLEGLDAYITEDITRLTTKLAGHHEKTKETLREMYRPVLDPTLSSQDGGAALFNDGNEANFVAGDFAEDLGEDYFGFKELGMDKEFGLENMSIPLHLLQSRIRSTHQPQSIAVSSSTGTIMEEPAVYPPLTVDSVDDQIGIVRTFFRERFEKNDGPILLEDENLPAKQRFPKPRLPPTGKISSPRKRPLREQQMMARKKRRMEIEAEREREREANGLGRSLKEESVVNGDTANGSGPSSQQVNGEAQTGDALKPVGKLKLPMPKQDNEAGPSSATDPTKRLTNGDTNDGAERDAEGDAEGDAEADAEGDPDAEGDADDDGEGGRKASHVSMPIAAH